jgi:hypothetical protein
MPLAGFERTIPVFKRAKTFHALDRAASVNGTFTFTFTWHINTNLYKRTPV